MPSIGERNQEQRARPVPGRNESRDVTPRDQTCTICGMTLQSRSATISDPPTVYWICPEHGSRGRPKGGT